jgi:signal peptidase
VVAWGLIIAAVAAVVVGVLVPRLGGATPYAVLTSSMRPSLPPGTLVVVRPGPLESIGVGSVITYQLRSGEPEVVTHRVVAVSVDGAGARMFRTRGDANDVADAGWVKPVQVKGQVWYAVPQLGRLHAALSEREHRQLVYLTAAALLALAAAMCAGAVRDRHVAATQVRVGGATGTGRGES